MQCKDARRYGVAYLNYRLEYDGKRLKPLSNAGLRMVANMTPHGIGQIEINGGFVIND